MVVNGTKGPVWAFSFPRCQPYLLRMARNDSVSHSRNTNTTLKELIQAQNNRNGSFVPFTIIGRCSTDEAMLSNQAAIIAKVTILKRNMKSKEMNFANVEVVSIAPMRNRGRLGRIARVCARIPRKKGPDTMTLRWYFAGLSAIGYFTFAPLTIANGNSAGHMSAMGRHENGQRNEHCRYPDPFWAPSFAYHAGIYNSDYSYTPTAEQQAKANQQVEAYLLAVKERRKHAATHRYISVETLRPTKKQLEDFTRKQPPSRRVEPAQLRCLMVFDTQNREFVGSGCYVVSGKPSAGEVAQFETVSAEFVGHGTL